MKRINVSELIPGMVTAEDVYNYNDQLILPKGLTLTDKNITRLEFYSILSIRIDDGQAEETSSSPVPIEQPYSERIKASPEFREFKEKFDENLDDFKQNMNDIVQKGAPMDVHEILDETMALLHNTNGPINIFDMLHNMRQYDDLTYAHSMNVALICNVFAGWLHMSAEDIEMATLCGIFHDIGKLAIPDTIVKKPSKLTDEEYNLIKTHTVEGYHILQKQDISIHVKNAALMHHERCDGKGYPLGLSGDKIDKFAKMVAIADVYDAMTAARVYRGPLCPFKVIEIFEKEGLQRYEAEYILTFLENVVLTYMNNTVRLTDGTEGKIIYINKDKLSKPMIQTADKRFIDLSKEHELSIDAIV